MTAVLNSFDMACPTQFLRGRAIVTAAKATYGDLANAVEILRYDINNAGGPIGGSKGGLIKSVTALPRATVSASQLLIFSSLDNGATIDLRLSALMAAFTMGASAAVPVTDFGLTEDAVLRVAAGERLWAASAQALAAGIVFNVAGDGFDS